jgi:uncharacterized membrane protein
MAEEPAKKTNTTTKEDVEKNKTMAILAWILFFIPLLTDAKDSKYAKFHANQSLLVTILYVVAGVTSFLFIGFLLYPVAFIFWIMGIISASQGEMKRLPIIGNIDIIK